VRKHFWPTLLGALIIAAVPASAQAAQDKGNARPTVSFFSGGQGANAHWQHDAADSPSDDNQQDIEINTTAPDGFAGVDVHHVYGTPTASYPDSSFDVKSDAASSGVSLGSPRLVVRFSDGGNASLRPLTNTTSWQTVAGNNWDNNQGGCGFLFQATWNAIQACHPGTFVTDVFLVADPYDRTHWIDNLNTAGKTWSQAADNGRGDN